MDINWKRETYNSIPRLKKIGISEEKLFEAVDDYHSLGLDTLDNIIFDSIGDIIESQEQDGYWLVISKKEFLKSAPSSICEEPIDEMYPSSNDKVARTWSNALLTLILTKADQLYKNEEKFTSRFYPKIQEAIRKSSDWIKKQKKKSGDHDGWAHCPLEVCKHVSCEELNIYDTSFAISTMINFERYSDSESNGDLPIHTLISDDFYNAKEGAWCIAQKKDKDDVSSISDVGATSYAAIALNRYINYWKVGIMDEEKKEFVNNRIKNGIEWLLRNQNPDGGWGLDSKNKNSRIDRTCFAIQALVRNGYSHKRDVQVFQGFYFLNNRLKEFDDSEFYTKLFLWDSDDKSDIEEENIPDRIKNTSLVISTFLKDKIPYNDYRIVHPLASLLKLHNQKGYNLKKFFDSAYLYCTLTDYLKYAKSHSKF